MDGTTAVVIMANYETEDRDRNGMNSKLLFDTLKCHSLKINNLSEDCSDSQLFNYFKEEKN